MELGHSIICRHAVKLNSDFTSAGPRPDGACGPSDFLQMSLVFSCWEDVQRLGQVSPVRAAAADSSAAVWDKSVHAEVSAGDSGKEVSGLKAPWGPVGVSFPIELQLICWNRRGENKQIL